jgi:hypothetical protein
MAVGHALRMHAGVVWIARGHHLALLLCAGHGLAALKSARAVAMCAGEGATRKGRNSRAKELERRMGPCQDYGGDACYRSRCMRTRTSSITTEITEREDVAAATVRRRVVEKRNTKWIRVLRRKSGAASGRSADCWRESRDRSVARPEAGESATEKGR